MLKNHQASNFLFALTWEFTIPFSKKSSTTVGSSFIISAKDVLLKNGFL